MKYVVCSPELITTSAGIVALHKLNTDLKLKGEQSRVISIRGFERIDPDEIVIYPDTTQGNPLKSRNAVRYLLMFAGYFGDDTEFQEDELMYYHSKDFILNGRNSDNILTVPAIDDIRFPYQPNNRSGVCYLAKKYELGFGKKPIDLPPGAIDITVNMNLDYLFKYVQKLITYDNSSINLEAALCGIEVEYRFNKYFEKPISLGDDFDWSKPLDSYKRLKERYWDEQLPEFIKRTKERFQ